MSELAEVVSTVMREHEPRGMRCLCGAQIGDGIDRRWHLANSVAKAVDGRHARRTMSDDELLGVNRTPGGWLVIDLAPIGGDALVWEEKLHIPDESVAIFLESLKGTR